MDAKINELLAAESTECEYYESEENEFDVALCIRSISKPEKVTINSPVIHMDKDTYFYSFNCKELNFEDTTYISPTDEIRDIAIVEEDKRYLFMLTTMNKVTFCPFGNFEARVNFCKDVVQMIKVNEKIFFLVKKEESYHVNEVAFKDGRFSHKIITESIKEPDLSLIGTNKTFFMHSSGKIYDKNYRWNTDYRGNFIHQCRRTTVIGLPETDHYQLSMFVEGGLTDVLKIPTKNPCALKGADCFLVVLSDGVLTILRILDNKFETFDKLDIDFTVFAFDVHFYEEVLFVTVLTDKIGMEEHHFVIDLTNKEDLKTMEMIYLSSNLKMDIKENDEDEVMIKNSSNKIVDRLQNMTIDHIGCDQKVSDNQNFGDNQNVSDNQKVSDQNVSDNQKVSDQNVNNLDFFSPEEYERIEKIVLQYLDDNKRLNIDKICQDIRTGKITDKDKRKILTFYNKIMSNLEMKSDLRGDLNQKVVDKIRKKTSVDSNNNGRDSTNDKTNRNSLSADNSKNSLADNNNSKSLSDRKNLNKKSSPETKTTNEEVIHVVKDGVKFSHQNKNEPDRFDSFRNSSLASTTTADAYSNKILNEQRKLFREWEERMDEKIAVAIEKAMGKTNLYRDLVLKTFAPKMEACVNEIRLQVLDEFKDLKATLIGSSSSRSVEYLSMARDDPERALREIVKLGKDDFEEVVSSFNQESNSYSWFNDEELILFLRAVINEQKWLDSAVFSTSVESLLTQIHLIDGTKPTLQAFSSALKSIESSTKISVEKNQEIFCLVNYFRKKVKKLLTGNKKN